MKNHVEDDIERDAVRYETYKLIIKFLLGEDCTNSLNTNSDYDLMTNNGTTIEVKVDDKCLKTGNIAIEVKGNCGQASGLSVTKADWWMHLARISDDGYTIFLIPTSNLRRMVPRYPTVTGREGSTVALIPIEDVERYGRGSVMMDGGRVGGLMVDVDLDW